MSPIGLLAILLAGGDRLDASMSAGEFPRTTSVLLKQGGRIVHERYFAGTDAGTLRDVRSVGKSITGLAVGLALSDGKIPSVDAPVFGFFADRVPPAKLDEVKRGITVADLLTMSSALDCNDDDPDSPGNEEHTNRQPVWLRWALDLPVQPGYRRDAGGRGPWFYCTAGVFLLGQVLEQATGQPVDRYIERRLFAPLGIRRVVWRRSSVGEVMTGGQLSLTTRDLARLGTLLLDKGRWAGRTVVPQAWVEAMLTRRHKPNRSADPKGELDYGYQLWRRDYRTACGRSSGWFMSGNGGNHVVMFRELDAVAVVTTVNYNTRGMHEQSWRLVEEHLLSRLPCRAP